MEFRANGYRAFSVAVFAVGSSFFLWGNVTDHPSDRTLWLAFVVSLGFCIRAWRLAVVVQEDRLLIRSWWWTWRIPVADIAGLIVDEYSSAAWVRGGRLACFDQLRIERRDGSEFIVSPIVGLRRASGGTVHKVADALRAVLGLTSPPKAEPSPRHAK
jgi:hypothetical protein